MSRRTGSFSRRHGLHDDVEITIHDDAPAAVRAAAVQVAREPLGPKELREIVCQALRTLPDKSNWSNPNVWDEVQHLITHCPWSRVYDVIEAISKRLGTGYDDEINTVLAENGIGWQVHDGRVTARGEEEFEQALRDAQRRLAETKRPTAARELAEARADLSRRPTPDLSGAVQHAFAGLEALARDLDDGSKATLGDLIKKRAAALGISPPLDSAIEKLWGFASERARHGREGAVLSRVEVELVVAVCASVVTYLLGVQREHAGEDTP